MMQLLFALIAGLIQGLTEFIPVSSSGHLVIFNAFITKESSSFIFDTLLNVGTLAALLIYFRKTLYSFIVDWKKNKSMILALVLGTIPAIIVGLSAQSIIEQTFRGVYIVIGMLVFVAVLMFLVESIKQNKNSAVITPKIGLLIGLAQCLAFVPGTSRSGITIVAAMFLGLHRKQAAEFSFLLALPVLGGGVFKVLLETDTQSYISANPAPILVGILASFVSGYLAVAWLLKLLARHSLKPFAYYRIALAAILLVISSALY